MLSTPKEPIQGRQDSDDETQNVTSQVAEVKTPNRKKILLLIGTIIFLVAAALVAFVFTKPSDKPSNTTNSETVKNEGSANGIVPSQENGYTGKPEDVLTIQEFECAPRSDKEWYRTDRTFVVDHKNPDTMYVSVEYKGIFKSTDAGKTWSQKTKGIKVYARKDDKSKGCYGEYPVIRMNPTNNMHLVIGLSGGGGGFLDPTTPNSQVGGVYQTFDGGETWKLMITNKMNVYVTDVAFDPKDANTVYYSTASNPASWQEADQTKLYVEKGLLYKTTDLGKTWTELPTGIGKNTSITNILINASQTNVINAPTFSATRVSADGTGAGISTGKDANVGQLGVLTTTNGEQWTTLAGTNTTPYIRAFASGANWQNQFYVPSQEGIQGMPYGLYTKDGGKTLNKTTYMDIVAYDPFDTIGAVMIGYSAVGWTPSDTAFTLYKSVDAGKSWSKYGKLPKEIANPNDAKTRASNIFWSSSDKNTLYMNGHGGLTWKSTDLGNTWTKLLDYTQL